MMVTSCLGKETWKDKVWHIKMRVVEGLDLFLKAFLFYFIEKVRYEQSRDNGTGIKNIPNRDQILHKPEEQTPN